MGRVAVVAEDLRKRAGQLEPAFSTERIVDTCFPGAFITGGRLSPKVDGLASHQAEGPLIVYERSLPVPDRRMTIACALSHLLFGDGSGVEVPVAGASATDADEFAVELLAPLAEVQKSARLFPSSDPDEHELYLDHVDDLAAIFVVPADVIDSQIRRLVPT
jgi:hypothetical protein